MRSAMAEACTKGVPSTAASVAWRRPTLAPTRVRSPCTVSGAMGTGRRKLKVGRPTQEHAVAGGSFHGETQQGRGRAAVLVLPAPGAAGGLGGDECLAVGDVEGGQWAGR
jgi:hypothetical protein